MRQKASLSCRSRRAREGLTISHEFASSIVVRFVVGFVSIGAQRLRNANTPICDGMIGRPFEVTSRERYAWLSHLNAAQPLSSL
jgi:hypothetical protein